GITFPDLLKGIMARLRDLKGIYHPDCDMANLPPEFFKLAGQVKNTGRLERCRRRRPYPAQDKVMDLGGWTGSLTFTEPVSPFLPLLQAGSLIGVGRKLTYGLGRFSLF
ncbi:MAG: CRISPR system precrRNA processing endoribonuclease RAMP protein Cas6, partial [Desulfobacteraceae bacterium]|nr:CRISPR system precrRNA processing endoribonuclease RAMP protein Cas6 [Desulfobacteraceae bacterium]